jgi:cellulose synthase/poly-beta-1,6-N-acetylglucosamine synthase-like glycosyltransferase
MEFILDLLYIFVAAYTIYFLALAIRNFDDKTFQRELRHIDTEPKENLAVIVYAHNNKKSLENLISELKNQNYPVNKFRIFVLLDNCTDDSQNLFTEENFVHVIDIKGVGTIGKDQAVATLLEKLSDSDFIDSYVFLDADRSIDSNFL